MSQITLLFPDMDEPARRWPEHERFPINSKLLNERFPEKRTAGGIIIPDLDRSRNYLIVTGYLSLSNIIDTFARKEHDGDKPVRILLGFEPELRGRKHWQRHALDQQVVDYWLERGISPFKSGTVVRTLELIDKGTLSFKLLDRMHGKLYVGDAHAVMGSSNFSKNGLAEQIEANVRFAVGEEGSEERSRYDGVRELAENYYALGRDFTKEIRQLLDQILKEVDWQEALARAIAEVLEGRWLSNYKAIYGQLDSKQLWPCQLQGVARGIQILRSQGNLLVADPTGSGKTKMVSTIQLAMLHWLWSTGQGERAHTQVICPAMVASNWSNEQLEVDLETAAPISMGILQTKTGKKKAMALRRMGRSRILVLDEAHNYLNKDSNRSASLTARQADHMVLATATPINRRAEDLLRLIELLDPDNLSDAELAEYQVLRAARPLVTDPDTLQRLRRFIWKFTLRRTKKQINAQVDLEPAAYTNALGKLCRYPEHVARTYPTGETDADSQAAERIMGLAHGLKGLIYLRRILKPTDRNLDTKDERLKYLKGRLGAANALACYRLHASLRSSRAALVEHVRGTRAAAKQFNLIETGETTGDMVSKLRTFRKELPVIASIFQDLVPNWLSDSAAYATACDEEIAIYERMATEATAISDSRERTKAQRIAQAVKEHGLVVAFDHTVITLHQIAAYLKVLHDAPTALVATGGRERVREQVKEHFGIGSKSTGIVALCSDSMSEGLNLQQASALVLLDMPSVLRLAEQRIGRIDRLDSPHPKIQVYWPGDSPAFALRADRNLWHSSKLTDKLLGGNLDLPLEIHQRYADMAQIDPQTVAAELEEQAEAEWEGVNDAFSEVYALKEGPRALLPPQTYEDLKNANATVRCKVSYTQSHSPWAFFALRGTDKRAPRWVFLEQSGEVTTEYEEVCKLLRARLVDANTAPRSETDLEYFIELFRRNERLTLPHKKRRVLDVAERMLAKQYKFEKNRQSPLQYTIQKVHQLFSPTASEDSVDLERFAATWLDLLQPRLDERRRKVRSKRQFVSIADLPAHALEAYFTKEELDLLLDSAEYTISLEQQIAACIVGVLVNPEAA